MSGAYPSPVSSAEYCGLGTKRKTVRQALHFAESSLRFVLMMKRLLILGLSFALLTAACGQSETPDPLSGVAADIYGGECMSLDGRQVTIYSGRSQDLMEPVLDAFECETGIELAVRYGSATELALLLAEEGDRSKADVFLSNSPGPIGFLAADGLLGKIDDDVLGLVEPQNRATNGEWVGFSGRKRVTVYNTEAITDADLPNSIFELTDEKWRGRVAIPGTNGSFQDWFTVFRDQHGSDVATQWINDMVANDAKYYPNNRSIVEAAGRGEIDLGLVNHYYNFQVAENAGADHQALNHDLSDDDIGSLLIITAAALVETSDRPGEANELLGYLLSEPVQSYYTEETYEYPLAAGVAPKSVLPPLAARSADTIDYDSLGGDLESTLDILEESGIANQ